MTAVIFDMDGIIFDSEKIVYQEWKDIFDKYGYSGLDSFYRNCIGANAASCKKIFLDNMGTDFPYDALRDERSSEYHKQYNNGKLPLKKGIRELLTLLKSKKIYTVVASSTRTEVVKKQIESAGLDRYFNRIFGGDSVINSKPKPDIFLNAVSEINDKNNKIFVIEDSYNGIRAAKAANMISIMVPDLLPPNAEMKNISDYIFSDLIEVCEFFDNYIKSL